MVQRTFSAEALVDGDDVPYGLEPEYMLRSSPRWEDDMDGSGGEPTPTRDLTGVQPACVVVIGGGFAGFFAARRLARRLDPAEAVVTLISDTDGLLYQPLLPEVAVGALDARSVAVPLASTLPAVRLMRGTAARIDTALRTVHVRTASGADRTAHYDRLIVTAGSVTRMFDVPGLAEHAVGFKTAAQALYLRDLVLTRLEAADDEADGEARRALLAFIVVGAGYAGTELTAQMARMSAALARRFPRVGLDDIHWILVDTADRVMPELGTELGERALRVLRRRGVDVRLQTSVASVSNDGVHLTDGSFVDGASVVWCAGVTPSPLVADTGFPVQRGRITVEPDLTVPGHPGVYAAGDAAAVPDLTARRGMDGRQPLCPPTAQHAMRQGRAVADSVVADIRGRSRRPYRHHDLGLVVDLGGRDAVARPLGVPLSGPIAKLVARGYHVYALPTLRRRVRVLTDWLLAGRTPDDVSFGLPTSPVLADDEHRAGPGT